MKTLPLILIVLGTSVGCHAPMPTLDPFAAYGPRRVPPPATGSIGPTGRVPYYVAPAQSALDPTSTGAGLVTKSTPFSTSTHTGKTSEATDSNHQAVESPIRLASSQKFDLAASPHGRQASPVQVTQTTKFDSQSTTVSKWKSPGIVSSSGSTNVVETTRSSTSDGSTDSTSSTLRDARIAIPPKTTLSALSPTSASQIRLRDISELPRVRSAPLQVR